MSSLPTISLVTPSFNQGDFIESTIRSVLDQKYPRLEYLVLDGGSTDGSADIIEKHADQLTYWRSHPDDGQYAAINEGFRRCTGEVMGWINSDDLYAPWALSVVGEVFAQLPEVEWITTIIPLMWNHAGLAVHGTQRVPMTRNRFMRMAYAHDPATNGYFIQQESTFWRRSLWERAGGELDTSLVLAADFELWSRFFGLTRLYGVATPLGGFRVHPGQKTAIDMKRYTAECEAVMARLLSSSRGTRRFELSYPSIQYDHDRGCWTVVELPVRISPIRSAVGGALRAVGLRK